MLGEFFALIDCQIDQSSRDRLCVGWCSSVLSDSKTRFRKRIKDNLASLCVPILPLPYLYLEGQYTDSCITNSTFPLLRWSLAWLRPRACRVGSCCDRPGRKWGRSGDERHASVMSQMFCAQLKVGEWNRTRECIIVRTHWQIIRFFRCINLCYTTSTCVYLGKTTYVEWVFRNATLNRRSLEKDGCKMKGTRAILRSPRLTRMRNRLHFQVTSCTWKRTLLCYLCEAIQNVFLGNKMYQYVAITGEFPLSS